MRSKRKSANYVFAVGDQNCVVSASLNTRERLIFRTIHVLGQNNLAGRIDAGKLFRVRSKLTIFVIPPSENVSDTS